MNKSEIFDQLTLIFRSIFKDDKIILTEQLSADDVEKWDSLTNTLMLDKVEKHFKIKLSFREIVNIKNTGELVDIINTSIKNK
jgi:acyl carrier protein